MQMPRTNILLSLAVCGLFALCVLNLTENGASAKAGNPYLGKTRHVVLYAYKADTTPEMQAEIAEKSRKLIEQIPLIEDLEWGTNVGDAGRAQGFTHCLLMTFANQAAVKEYAATPQHQEFLKLAMPHLEKLMVVDYVAQE